ncbi:MAG: hypothetical protein EOO77_04485 [Oxalobacteraceae bacterium]|nr:MAG: hypothetical protein EOO77_04485 [Oxalobacteraceae bacterium]
MIDRDIPPRPASLPSRQWPAPLVMTFVGVVLANLLLIYVAFEIDLSSPAAGGDAAGNAMSAGFNALIEYAALFIVGVPSLLFMLIRRRGYRVVMVVLLGLNALVLLMLASLIHAHP